MHKLRKFSQTITTEKTVHSTVRCSRVGEFKNRLLEKKERRKK